MDRKIIIVGASGHGKVAADISELLNYKYIAFLDDDKSIFKCMGYPVVGRTNEVEKFAECDFFVAIGNSQVREKIQNTLIQYNLKIVTLIHPRATIAKNVSIGIGTIVMAGAVVNSDSKIGMGCIVNTGATVDHDNVLDDYVHVAVGSHLSGCVHIGKSTWIGAGATVSNNVTVCSDCMIGAGAVVIKNIHEAGTYVGVPAKKKQK